MPRANAADSSNRTPSAPTGVAGRPYIGGQAVLEGVMMRSPTSFAVVVRSKDGTLHVRERGVPDDRKGAAKLPMVRGVASLVESLRLGSEALRFSGEIMERDLEAAEAAGIATSVLGVVRAIGMSLFAMLTADAGGGPDDVAPEPKVAAVAPPAKTESKSKGPMVLMLVLMVGFMIALPQAAAAGANKALGLNLAVQSPGFQAMTGLFKLGIVVGYMMTIRRALPDIRRVFQYHGAEHKTISTYEAGEPLTVDNARAKTTLHPRCGTTFLVMVALVSILVFTAVGGFMPKIETGKVWLDNVIFFAMKLPFLPVIAAVTFEIQRVFARYCTTGPLRALLWPGFLCQKITTIEPDDAQLEVALASLRVTLFREEGVTSEAERADVTFDSFGTLMASPRLGRAA